MHLWFSFFQPSSHFSWDTHSKQSFHLDEEGFLWLSFYSFGHWSNSFDLCRTLHALDVSLSCICASCIFLYVLFCFFLLILLYLFYFWVCSKIQKPIKIEKSSKSLIACVVYITCEFGLVPSYKWRNAFTNLACYICIYIFVGEILKTMCDCCK